MLILMPLVERKNLISPKSIASTNGIASRGVVAARACEQLAIYFRLTLVSGALCAEGSAPNRPVATRPALEFIVDVECLYLFLVRDARVRPLEVEARRNVLVGLVDRVVDFDGSASETMSDEGMAGA
jgi:hypothetical protein